MACALACALAGGFCTNAAAAPARAQPPTGAGAITTTEADALHALNRLGYGPAPGEVAHVMQVGVDRYVDEQLHPERLALPADLSRQLASLTTAGLSQRDLITQFREAAEAAKTDGEEGKARRRDYYRQLDLEAGEARLWSAARSPRQLEERMVDFWFNHFNVFIGKGLDRVLVANYEREAIRPYALGRFRDLLGATAHHPAMLFYLDNWQSVAAGFQPQQQRAAGAAAKPSGLNENYARELMELHTLGVDGGYSQQDVTELARVLTGWTFAPRLSTGASVFVFDARRHDNGDKLWLGQRIGDQGQAEGEHALDLLAASPATARHLGFELAQYFVADQPPQALVERLAQRYQATGGDIRAMLELLFASPEFRSAKVHDAKFKTPYDYVVSSVRVAGVPIDNVQPLLGTLRQLGMPLYGCQTPDGYKNTQDAWLNPDAITRRIGFATALAAGKLPGAPTAPVDADALLATLGGEISPKTRATIAEATPDLRAPMVLGSPEFMHR
jgi:uncharacterized protein (DUF1800 family)